MAQLSRPYQIGLAGIVLLAAVWVIALRGHSASTPSGSSSTPPSVASSGAHSSSGPTAPGVAGLGKDVAKAHEAVATSERNAAQLQQKSEQASSTGSAATTHSAAPGHASSKTSTHAGAPVKPAGSSSGAHARSSHTARQGAVEAALKRGDVAVLLFWDRHGSDDVAVHQAVQSLKGAAKVFTSQAGAGEVASYGSITRGIQVYGTPTILIVNPKGETITLTGLQDAYSIRQAIAEARHP